MISIFKPKFDEKYLKLIRLMAALANETAGIREILVKIVLVEEENRDFLRTVMQALIASMSSQVETSKKMEKFFDLQIKWSEEQQKFTEKLKETDDDRIF